MADQPDGSLGHEPSATPGADDTEPVAPGRSGRGVPDGVVLLAPLAVANGHVLVGHGETVIGSLVMAAGGGMAAAYLFTTFRQAVRGLRRNIRGLRGQ